MGKEGAGVVVDSHLWVEFLSGEESEDTVEVEALIRSRSIVLAGPIVFELLIGPRQEGQRQYLHGRLRAFPMLATTDQVWFKSVELGRLPAVAKRRVPFSDVLIAAHAELHGCALFSRDPHFDVFPHLMRHGA